MMSFLYVNAGPVCCLAFVFFGPVLFVMICYICMCVVAFVFVVIGVLQ